MRRVQCRLGHCRLETLRMQLFPRRRGTLTITGTDPAAQLALEAQIERYIEAIGQGGFSPALKARLAAAGAEKAQLLGALPPRPQPNVLKLVTDAFGRSREMVGSPSGLAHKRPRKSPGGAIEGVWGNSR